MEKNLWEFKSLYELQFFNCPACDYKNKSKQKFVDHACNIHPESINYLMNVQDGSIGEDVLCPWNKNDVNNTDEIFHVEVKQEMFVNEGAIEEDDEKFENEEYSANDSEIEVKKYEPPPEKNKPLFNPTDRHFKHVTPEFWKVDGDGNEHGFKCDICSVSFTTDKHLKIHIHFVHEKNRNKEHCDICDITFKTTKKAMDHFEEIHLGIKKDKPSDQKETCKYCSKTFKKTSLKIHIKQVHEFNEQLDFHKCDLCEKVFRAKKGLDDHKFVIHEGKRYECTIMNCDEKFMTPETLKEHPDYL